MSEALGSVLKERVAQDAKWGEQNHDPFMWIAILTEEVGEFAQAVLQNQWEHGPAPRLREEAVQVAAVALAIVECCDRNRWTEERTLINRNDWLKPPAARESSGEEGTP